MGMLMDISGNLWINRHIIQLMAKIYTVPMFIAITSRLPHTLVYSWAHFMNFWLNKSGLKHFAFPCSFSFFQVCMCMCIHVCSSTSVEVRRPLKLILSLHHVGYGDWTQVTQLVSRCLYLLSHLSSLRHLSDLTLGYSFQYIFSFFI